MTLRLGVNVDHVATIRNARGGIHPDPVAAARMAVAAGADGITAHLREDRRHIRDDDMRRIKAEIHAPLNFEMATTDEMLTIALAIKPHACCLVPEKRTEVTTEGGLNVADNVDELRPFIRKLSDAGIRVSLFIDPDPLQVDAAKAVGAHIVELHTGSYAHETGAGRSSELRRLVKSAACAADLGIECHAGHGLDFDNVADVAAIPQLVELNIGHFLVGEAVFGGLPGAVRTMRRLMDLARRLDSQQ
jgi:pyridoxine 5-phosphate synthase